MMSENLSFVSSLTIQKNLFKRRIWLIALALLVFLVYFIGFPVLTLMDGMTDKTPYLLQEADNIFGSGSFASVITIVGAVLLGIQGFAWMDSRKKLDFYESLPVSRSKRFWNITLNSFIIYICSYIIGAAAGILTCTALGYGGRALFSTALIYIVRNAFLFMAVYASSVLAVMLTGNVIVSVLAAVFLLLYEPALDMIIYSCFNTIFATFAGESVRWTYVFSPCATLSIDSCARAAGLNLLYAAAALLIAFLVYRHRNNEDAGKAVLYAPVRVAAKIAAAALVALMTGLLFQSSAGTAAGIISAIAAAVIVSGIMETIYAYSVKAVFRDMAGTVAAAVIPVVILCCFCFDVTGYDTWVPEPSAVKSAYISDYESYYTDHYLNSGKNVSNPEEYYKKYMRLTDTEDVNKLLAAGEKEIIKEKKENKSSDEYACNIVIGYRMKSGKIVRRSVVVNSTVKDAMDRVTGSDAFRKGYFQIYHDDYFRKNIGNMKVSFSSGIDGSTPASVKGNEIYPELVKAYKEDLKKFNYSLAGSGNISGEISVDIEKSRGRNRSSDEDTLLAGFSLPVYNSFSNTIACLQKHGIYQEPTGDGISGPFGFYSGDSQESLG